MLHRTHLHGVRKISRCLKGRCRGGRKKGRRASVSAQKLGKAGRVRLHCLGHLCQVSSVVSAAALQQHLLLRPLKSPLVSVWCTCYHIGLIRAGVTLCICFGSQNNWYICHQMRVEKAVAPSPNPHNAQWRTSSAGHEECENLPKQRHVSVHLCVFGYEPLWATGPNSATCAGAGVPTAAETRVHQLDLLLLWVWSEGERRDTTGQWEGLVMWYCDWVSCFFILCFISNRLKLYFGFHTQLLF